MKEKKMILTMVMTSVFKGSRGVIQWVRGGKVHFEGKNLEDPGRGARRT